MNNFQELSDLLNRYQSYAISTHVNPDGDAIGSELALYRIIKNIGKTVRIFNTDKVPKKYQFLPDWNDIEDANASVDYSADVLIILDASSKERIGSFLSKNFIPTHSVINIDHHITAESFGDYNLIVPTVSSTAEILYNFFKFTQLRIDEETALCLYTGIMFDTGCFRHSNTTPETHRIAAELIELGAFEPDEVYNYVYEHISIGKIRLLEKTLRSLELSPDGKIGWVVITQAMLSETNTTLDDIEGFVNQIQAIDSVVVSICICEMSDSYSKVSLRSNGRVDVAALAKEFNGGGHERASGCRIDRPLSSAITMLVESAKRHIQYGN